MSKIGGGKYRRGRNAVDSKMAQSLDELAAFEEFRNEVLPMLRRDMKSGLSPKEMRKKYQSFITARVLSIAIGDPDTARALAAAKDIQDREEGRAKETVDHNHKYQDMKEEQLDALLLSKLKNMKSSEDKAN